MTKTEYNQFIIELEFIGKDKNYVGIFNKVGKALSFKTPDELLLDKRNAYNFQVSKLFDQYGINNEELFESFNKIWKFVYIKHYNNLSSNYIAGVAGLYAQRLNDLHLLMKNYINYVYKYCETYAKSEVI